MGCDGARRGTAQDTSMMTGEMCLLRDGIGRDPVIHPELYGVHALSYLQTIHEPMSARRHEQLDAIFADFLEQMGPKDTFLAF